MIKPLSLFLGLRYTRAKKRNHFISFISLISVIGIALGVAVLIIVLSVMNGFDYQIKHRILSLVPQVTVSNYDQTLDDWQSLEKWLKRQPDVVATAPFVQAQAMMTYNSEPAFISLQGIDPAQEREISPIATKMIRGSIDDLKPGRFGIILGEGLAQQWGVSVGDKVTVYVPKTTLSPVGMLPRLKQFTVTGIFKVGYEFDYSYALVNWQDAAKLLLLHNQVSGIQLKLTDLFLAPYVAHQLNGTLPAGLQAVSWVQQNANFFKALKMEKLMMFLILVLIIAVAAFNMLASLVMIVTDKQSDIAILKTIGVKTRTIMMTFIIQGLLVGAIGMIAGIVGGVILALNVTDIVNWLQTVLHTQFLNSDVYFIDFLPSQLMFSDVWHIAVVALLLSFLATLYPAWRASHVHPATALRYE